MWNYELFIARRIIAGKRYKNSVSSPITKIGVIAVALGIIVMLVSIATGVGLKIKIREKISGFFGHVRIVNFDENNSLLSTVPVSVHQDFYPEFKGVPQVKHIQVFAQKSGIIKTATDFEGVVLKGVGEDYDWTFFKNYLVSGHLPDFTGDKTSDEVLISSTILDRLKLKTGDEIHVWFVRNEVNKMPKVRKFHIAGVYNSGFPDFDKVFVIADIRQIQRLNKWKSGEVGGFEVILQDFDHIQEITDRIYRMIPSELDAYSIKEKFPIVFEWISLFDSNIAVILVLMFIVAGFNMITVLLVMVLERVRLIGVLKALGEKDMHIRRIFLYLATYLIFQGLFWGNLLGLSFLLFQKHTGFIRLDPRTYYVNHVPVDINITYILILNAGVVILSYLLLLLPSYFITKVNAVRAIRFE